MAGRGVIIRQAAARPRAIPLLAACLAAAGSAADAATVSLEEAFAGLFSGIRIAVVLDGESYGTLDLPGPEGFNADGRLVDSFTVFACDGSVKVACDGSVRETIQVAISASANPSESMAVTSTGTAANADIAIGAVYNWALPFLPADVELTGRYELEFPLLPGVLPIPPDDAKLTLAPLPGHPGLFDDMLGLRPDWADDAVATHGADFYELLFGDAAFKSGSITTGGSGTTLTEKACDIGQCLPRVLVTAFSVDNPAGAERRAYVEATASYTAWVIPLPATGWLLLGALGLLALQRRR